MKKLSILFAALMACTLSFAAETIILDGGATPLPKSTETVTTEETTISQNGYSYTMSAGGKKQAVQKDATNAFDGTEDAILIGKSGAYIYNTTPFEQGITKFELYANKGASTKVSVSVSFSQVPLSKAQTAKDSIWSSTLKPADKVYEVVVPAGAKYFYYTVTNGNNSQVAFRITNGNAEPDAVAKPTFTPAESDFVGSVEVALAAGEGLDIYYTLDGTEPTTASTKYTAPFTLTATTTIKAIAYNATTSKASEVAEKTYTAQTLMTCAEANAATDGTFIALGEVTVAYVNGANTYVKDATGYALIYARDFGLEAGQVVKGLQGNMKIFRNLPEIEPSVTKADLTITAGTVPEPEMLTTVPTMADINKYVRIENVTTTAATWSNSDTQAAARTLVGKLGENDITLYNTFKIDQTFEAANYNIIGVVTCYNTTVQIAVISAEKVEEPTPTTPSYCQTEVGHFLAEDAAPDSYVLLSIGSKNGKTIVRIDQDTKKNTQMFDYLQVTGIVTAGADVAEGGEKAMAVEFDTPATDADGNITLEILWSTVGWPGRWMVQNLKVSATDECEHAVLVGPGSAINNATIESNIVKRIENGILVIEKDGVRYNAQGVKLN